MVFARCSALALVWVLTLGCEDSNEGTGDTDANCSGHGEDPDPCCCFPEPGVSACDVTQLCPTIEADCGDGTLGAGICALDQASDGAVTCALTALGDPNAAGAIAWSVQEFDGQKTRSGTLHLGGSRAALESEVSENGSTVAQALVGPLPSDFDPEACAALDTAGARFECMLNASGLEDSQECSVGPTLTSSG